MSEITLAIAYKKDKYAEMPVDVLEVRVRNYEFVDGKKVETEPDKYTFEYNQAWEDRIKTEDGREYPAHALSGYFYKDDYEVPEEAINRMQEWEVSFLQLWDNEHQKEIWFESNKNPVSILALGGKAFRQ